MPRLTLTDDLIESIGQAVEQGTPLATAAQALGVASTTISEWLQAAQTGAWHAGTPVNPETRERLSRLSARVAHARAVNEARLVQSIATAAETVGRSGVPEWRAAAWMLNNHPSYRQQWHEHREVNVQHNGTVHHQLAQVQQLDTPQVVELAPQEFRELLALDAGYKEEQPSDNESHQHG